MRALLSLFLIPALVISALGACSDSDLSGVVEEALQKMEEVSTYRLTADLTWSGKAGTYSQTEETDFAGPTTWRTRYTYPDHWQEWVQVDDQYYLRSDTSPEWQLTGESDSTLEDSETEMHLVHIPPWAWIPSGYLQAIRFKAVADEQLEGVMCEVYTGEVDIDRLEKREDGDQSGLSFLKVWIDTEGYIRQIEAEVQYGEDAEIASGMYTSMRSTTFIYDLNAVITIEEPDVA